MKIKRFNQLLENVENDKIIRTAYETITPESSENGDYEGTEKNEIFKSVNKIHEKSALTVLLFEHFIFGFVYLETRD